ncbi:MAG: outer membrane beta-barrel protein [Rickettsiales bacterium]
MGKHLFTALSVALISTSALAAPVLDDQAIPQLGQKPAKAPISVAELAELKVTVGGDASLKYVDNIYREPNNTDSDFIAAFAPGFAVTSNFDKHAFNVEGNLEFGEYFDETRNNYIDGDLKANGRYDIATGQALVGYARYRHDHAPIGSFVDEPDRAATEPTDYRFYDAGAGYDARFNDIKLDIGTEAQDYNYDNTSQLGGGKIINDDRDHEEYYQTARLGYFVAPEELVYVKGIYNNREYDNRIDGTALFPRDSDGYEVLAGWEHAMKQQPIWFDASAGYISQNYDASVLPTVDGYSAHFDGHYKPTEQLTFTGRFSRSVEENTLFGASGYMQTRVSAGMDYIFMPQWTLEVDGRYTNVDFETNSALTSLDREDDIYNAGIGVTYDITELYNVGVQYLYEERESNDNSVEYDQNAFLVKVGINY